MAGKLEKIKLKLEISPFSEMGRQTERWCLDNRTLKKALTPFKFEDKAEIDTNRWELKDIEDGLRAIARYDLKVFDVAVIDARKTIDKAKPRDAAGAIAKAEKDIITLHAKLEKQILKKLSRALDEVSGAADDGKALADGKAALTKIADLDLEIVFKDIALQASEAVMGVVVKEKKLKKEATARVRKAGGDDDDMYDVTYKKGSDRAFFDCAKKLDGLSKEIRDVSKEAEAATKFLGKIGKKIKGDKKASPETNAFGKQIVDAQPVFDRYAGAVSEFRERIAAIVTEIKKAKMQPVQAELVARALTKQPAGMKAAKEVSNTAKSLAKSFKTLEKELG
ncbi:MAG: hypothetical protein AAFR46_01290 [Pseudomonadota bacterium]